MNAQERAAFEAWATDNGEYPKAVERDSAGNYRLLKVHTDWIAWQARAALAAAPQAPAVPQWLPIETAPMHKAVLLWWRTCLEPAIGRYVSDERGEGWKCDGDQAIPRNQGDCTHWMRLPAAPGAPQPAEQAPLDVCTDPYNCKRCAAPQWDKHKFEHAGLTSAAGVKEQT